MSRRNSFPSPSAVRACRTPQTTSADGCAFFAFQPIGAYTVSLNKAGYVNDQLLTGPSQSATVGAGSTVSLQFQYDNAATMNLTLVGGAGGVIPANIPVTLANTHLLPSGKKTFAGTGSSRSLLGLFPYVDGFESFAGSCLAADPEGMNGAVAIYPGASRDAVTSVTPGGTSAATVNLHSVIIHTQQSAVTPRPGATVTARNLTDAGCPTVVIYTVGATDASGNITAALPYGNWQFGVTLRHVDARHAAPQPAEPRDPHGDDPMVSAPRTHDPAQAALRTARPNAGSRSSSSW